MSVNPIDFDLPVWSVTVWHTERGADNPWHRAFNLAVGEGEEEAIKKIYELFKADGLSPITIYKIEPAELIPLDRGEDG